MRASPAAGPAGRPVVAITRPNLHGNPAERLATLADVRTWAVDAVPSEDALAQLAGSADALLCINGDPITASLIERLARLRLIAVASAGFDSVDVASAAARGIIVTNAPGVLSEAVADTTFGLMLATRRRLFEAALYVRAGEWNSNSLHRMVGLDVHGTTLGIVGYGAIGRALARRAQGFGMTVVYSGSRDAADPNATRVALDELLSGADIISLHVPLTPETRGLIGARELALMKPTATLLNTSRGAVIDEAALLDALRAGRIGSVGLDVQAVEPNPDPHSPLLGFPNVVVLPHIGSASAGARLGMINLAADNIVAVLEGREPLTPVRGSDRTTTGA